MHNLRNITQAVAAATLLLAGTAQAADWTIVQTTTLTATVSLTQGASTKVTGAIQALNSIKLKNTDKLTGSGSAQAVSTDSNITLTQGNQANSGATQSLNDIQALDIGTAAAGQVAGITVTQTVSGIPTTTLKQTNITGGSAANVQSINNAQANAAAGNVTNLNQTYTGKTTLDLSQTSGKSDDQQAVNRIALAASSTGSVGLGAVQNLTAADDNDFTQNSSASGLIQAGNLIDLQSGSMVGAVGTDDQVFTTVAGDTVDLIQKGGSGNNGRQALNAIVYTTLGAASTAEQQATLNGAVTLAQDDVGAAVQAINFTGTPAG